MRSGSITTFAEFVAGQKMGKDRFVRNWKDLIPPESHWFPGCPGDPSCQHCDGTGYVRADLPIGHPNFGEIFLCSCVNQQTINQSKLRTEKAVKEYGYKQDDE